MIRKQNTRRACWLALLVLLAPVVGAVPLASAAAASAPGPQQYAVVQGGECTTVTAIGNGDTPVTDHYDYRNPYNSEPGGYSYSSMGDTIQGNQESNLYIYDGADGTSLVMVHDARGDAPGGSTVTFDLSGLPSDGEWVVQDDNYPLKDDEWSLQNGQATIDWLWGNGRTDGGAFLGLNDMGDDGVTINPGFNQEADQWSTWNSESPTNQEMTAWTFRSGDGGSDVSLGMSSSVTIYQGSCAQNDLTGNLDAALDAPGETTVGSSVSFTASTPTGSADTYEWDFDGDGTVDQTTTTPNASTTHAYSNPGIYTASVTAAGSNTSDAAFATVIVNTENNEAPTATITGGGLQSASDGKTHVDPNSVVTFSAAETTDDVGIQSYQWNFGDGTTTTTQTAAVPHTFVEAGNYTVSVTATDTQGETATASMEVVVADTVAPTAKIAGPTPTNVSAGEAVSFSGAESTDANPITSYNWTMGDGTNLTGESITHTFTEAGTYNVTLSVVDQNGNVGTQFQVVTVARGDGPVAKLSNPGDVEANANVTLDASASSDNEGIETYRWNIDGEGEIETTTAKPTLTTSMSSTGPRTVTVTVVDGDGNTSSASVQFNITPEAPPTPAIDAPDTIDADKQLSVDASASTDNGNIASYEWTFGDGATATGATASHTYDSPGTYEVTVTVTDTLGHSATATHSVTVEKPEDNADPAPDPDPSPSPPSNPSPSPPPATSNIGFAGFSVSATELVQGENATVTATLRNTGDAAGTTTATFTAGNYSESKQVRLGAGQRTNVTFTHAFDEPGNYSVSINSKSRTVTVAPANSEFDVSETRVRTQNLSVGDAAIIQATVTNTGNVAGNYTLNLTMSDGSVVSKHVSLAAGKTTTVSFTPTVEMAGDHTVSLENETLSFSVRAPNTTSDPGTQTTSGPGTQTDVNDRSTPGGDDASSGSTPGFGLVAGLVAVLAAALLAFRTN